MFDNLNAHNGRDRARRNDASQQSTEPLTDREVPIGVSRTPSSVQAWLDGDTAESTIEGTDTRHVEFWARVNAETSRRRQVHTPVEVQQRIMAALPMTAPTAAMPWYRKDVTMNPAVAAAAAASLLAVGAAVGAALRQR